MGHQHPRRPRNDQHQARHLRRRGRSPPRPPDRPHHRPSVYLLHVTREAVDTIAAVDQYLAARRAHYGATSQIYRTAADVLVPPATLLFGMGLGADTVIRPDGCPASLSLAVQTASGMVFGIIFHRHRRHCVVPGCDATINDDGTVRFLDHESAVDDHEHQPSYPRTAPAPCEWQYHS